MNDKERFVKISKLKQVFETSSIDDIKKYIWESNNKFSVKYSMTRFCDEIEKDDDKLDEITDQNIEVLHNILVINKPKASFFESKKSVLEFLSSIYEHIDVDKVTTHIISEVNDVCESIKQQFQNYNPKDITSWGVNSEISDLYHSLFDYMVTENKLVLNKRHMNLLLMKKRIYESTVPVKEGKKDLYTMVYNVLDDSSIVLLYSYIFGKMVSYTSRIRDEVYDYLAKNPNSPAISMVTGEVTSSDYDNLRRHFYYLDAQSFMLDKSFIALRKNMRDKLCVIKYAGNNKFKIKELN